MRHLARASRSLTVRLVVTGALLTAIAVSVDWGDARQRIANGDWRWFALAVGLLFVAQLLGAARWSLLLRGAGIDRPLPHVVRAYLVGLFANNFLPTSFGGDAARAWVIAPATGPVFIRAVTSVLVDRVTAIWSLLSVAWIALLAEPDPVPRSLVVALLVVSIGGALTTALAVLIAGHGGRIVPALLPTRLLNWARQIRDTLWLYVREPKLLVAAFVLGIVFQAFVVTSFWATARAIDVQLPYSLAAVAAPIVLVITLIPISIAGFGVREGGMVVVLAAAAVSTTDATLLSLTGYVVVVIVSLPGAVAMLLPGHPAALPGRASDDGALSG